MKDVRWKSTVKYGGSSIIVCGCLKANGVGDLVRIDGIMNPSVKCLIGNSFVFQRNNNPKNSELKV